MSKHWTLDDIDWDKFDPALVDPNLLATIKTAAMVEGNAADYVTYLLNVFSDDEAFAASFTNGVRKKSSMVPRSGDGPNWRTRTSTMKPRSSGCSKKAINCRSR